MNTITRKSMLYPTGVEYGDYAMNHVLGCSHGCRYPCYAFLQKKRFGIIKSEQEWMNPILVSNTLELLDKELPRLQDKLKMVQLCFTTDPFMYRHPDVQKMSLQAIRKINAYGIPCSILTKGILPYELSKLSIDNWYGITLTSLDERYREAMEPGAAPFSDRLNALKALHEAGCKTWISIEPYPTPNICRQDLNELLNAVSFADKIVFGRTNYSKSVSSYPDCKDFYQKCAETVRSFCKEKGIECWIKKGTDSAS